MAHFTYTRKVISFVLVTCVRAYGVRRPLWTVRGYRTCLGVFNEKSFSAVQPFRGGFVIVYSRKLYTLLFPDSFHSIYRSVYYLFDFLFRTAGRILRVILKLLTIKTVRVRSKHIIHSMYLHYYLHYNMMFVSFKS